jgi:glycosyltransferase involved in cell wall biosynthesis
MRELSQRYGDEIALVAATYAPGDENRLDEVSEFANVLFQGIPVRQPNQFELASRSLWNSFNPRSFFFPLGILSFYGDPKLPSRIKSVVSRYKYDLAYVNGTMSYLLPLLNRPRICDPHDVISIALRQQIATTRVGMKKLALMTQYIRTDLTERMVFPHADRMIVVTATERDRLASRTGLVAEIVPNGVDTSFFRPQSRTSRDNERVLFFGDLSAPENVDAVVYLLNQVFPELRKRHNELKVDIVGRNPPHNVIDAAKRFGAHLYANVPDVRPYIARSRVCALPSYRGTGIKNKVLEAMAMGSPVVTTEIGAEGITSGTDSGLLVAKNDSEMLRLLERALSDSQWADEAGGRSRQRVLESFDWSITTRALRTVFEELSMTGPHQVGRRNVL